jgi:hypothetical protein
MSMIHNFRSNSELEKATSSNPKELKKSKQFSSVHGEGVGFHEFRSGGLHENHAVATSNLGTISTFA